MFLDNEHQVQDKKLLCSFAIYQSGIYIIMESIKSLYIYIFKENQQRNISVVSNRKEGSQILPFVSKTFFFFNLRMALH